MGNNINNINNLVEKKLFLIDGFALIYRAFFAFNTRPLITPEGQNVSALFGFFNSLFSLIEKERPEYIAVVLDTSAPTFRHKTYDKYKATREKMPDDLRSQLPILFEIIEATNIIQIKKDGFEADDLIGTLSEKATKEGFTTFIYSSDKDLAQLVNDKTYVYDPKDNKVYDREKIFERFEVYPNQIIDYLALMGDSSDNIPGVPKVGKKTAVNFLKEFGSIENVYNNIDNITKKAVKQSLIDNKNLADLSKFLVTIDTEVDLDGLELEELKFTKFNTEKLAEYFNKYRFKSLLKKLATVSSTSVNMNVNSDLKNSSDNHDEDSTFDLLSIKNILTEKKNYEIIDNIDNLKELIKKTLLKTEEFSLTIISSDEHFLSSKIEGISISVEKNNSFYIPITFYIKNTTIVESTYQLDLFSTLEEENTQKEEDNSDLTEILDVLKPLFIKKEITMIGYDLKQVITVLNNYGITVKNKLFDILIADYLLRNSRSNHSLENISYEHLNYTIIDQTALFGKGKQKLQFRDIEINSAKDYICEKSDLSLSMKSIFTNIFSEDKNKDLKKLFYTVEIPLIKTLEKMERTGILVNEKTLSSLSTNFTVKIKETRKKVHEIAGEEFNLDSPKQLSEILFEKMKLKHGRKGKSGNYSTDSSILEKIANSEEHSEIGKLLLEYREISKLRNTYIDGILKLINPTTKRIHTTYNQAVAATGRLSSKEPNLQSIPIKTEDGEKIRNTFIARDGYKLVAGDYSQIELRILAHYCKDENLIKAFKEDIDIHTMTASILFGVEIGKVDRAMRNKAKTVNFSIIYGKTKFTLAEDLGIDFNEASNFIDDYFEKFHKIRNYIEDMESKIQENGFVTTLFGRKREISEVRSSQKNIKNAALRQAVNAPIQGSSADIIKMSMNKIQEEIEKNSTFNNVKMLLQVHDELVFEVKESDVANFTSFLKKSMENVVTLSVPLDVNIGIGNTWFEAH